MKDQVSEKARRPGAMAAVHGFLSGQSEGLPGESSLADSALSGSFWLSTQWFLNKIATAGATLVIAYFLTPDEYGLAATVIAIAGFLCILPPKIMGDVLIAHPEHFKLLLPTVQRLAWCVGLVSTSVTLISIRWYCRYTKPIPPSGSRVFWPYLPFIPFLLRFS